MMDLWLVPLELRDAPALLSWLGEELESAFHVRARLFDRPVDVEPCRNHTRCQLDTRALLGQLLLLPEPGFVLGVTSEDLYFSIFTFVIGEACLGGRAAMVSTHRLHEERYGLPPNPARLRERLLKEAVHELGHCHGLVHCPHSLCVMHASTTAEHVDQKGSELCDACLRALGTRAKRKGRASGG
jgi:archaemetzincin